MEYPIDENYINQVSLECVIFGYQDNVLKVLISTLIFDGDFKTLPGGFIRQTEDIDMAAQRILKERTGIDNVYLEHYRTFGKASRNITTLLANLVEKNSKLQSLTPPKKLTYDWLAKRFISIGYYALVEIANVVPQKGELDKDIGWYAIDELPKLVLDQNEMVEEALKTLRFHVWEKINAFNLLPETFTMKEVQEVYETVTGKTFVRTNFQKMILQLNVLERLEKKFTGAANKAPYLYRFKK